MGLFGKEFESKETSSVGGGGKRVTTHYTGGSSEDKTYNNNGQLVDITHHESNGNEHSHNIRHDYTGPATGSIK